VTPVRTFWHSSYARIDGLGRVYDVVTGVLFLVATVTTPLVAVIPNEAAYTGAGDRGLLDDVPGTAHRLDRPRDRDPRVPDDPIGNWLGAG